MEEIIVFTCHTKPLICKNRLEILKKYNPKAKIFIIFGGPKRDYAKFQRILRPYIKGIYYIQGKTSEWKWKSPDLMLREWYQKIGYHEKFDRLYLLQWDILFFKPMKEIYKKIPLTNVGLTALNPLENVAKTWSWTSKEPYKSQWHKLLNYAKKKFNYNKKPYASLGPGPCFPQKFLEKYSKTKIPDLVHDELRFPLFAQILGFKLSDTRFYKKWSHPPEWRYFNCHGINIKDSVIKKELKKRNGRRVFHPYRKKYNPI